MKEIQVVIWWTIRNFCCHQREMWCANLQVCIYKNFGNHSSVFM